MDAVVQSEKKDITPLTQGEIETLTKETLFQKDTFERLYLIEDDLERTLMKQALEEKAKELGKGLVTKLRNVLKTCESNFQKMRPPSQRKRLEPRSTDFREITEYDDEDNPVYGDETPYDGYLIPDDWMISNDGIYKVGAKNITTVCGRPMLPIAIWRNLEDQREKAVLVHRVNSEWRQVEAPRSTISTSSSLTKLADFGLDANSKNATNLVSFLSDFINCNQSKIPMFFTTSKLGWKPKKAAGGIEYNFIPYYKGIVFDAEASFADLYGSIARKGNYEKWLNLAMEIRSGKPLAPKIALASSFASALIYPLGILGFFVDIYGATGGGKTITLMLACSVWANPNENKYIGDFAATRTALETRLDMLNSLPLLVDDTSKKASWVNYEFTIYDLTSGKGKTRSNTNLGNEPEKTWKNVIICNGEHAISDLVLAIGAKNRVIEVPCEDHLFQNPYDVAETVKRNYGHAGQMFVEAVKSMDWAKMRERFLEIQTRFTKNNISGKQASSGAVLLLADEIATEHIFKDGHALSFQEVEKLLLKENEISEGAECYQYLLDIIEANYAHFDGAPGGPYPSCEKWGTFDGYNGEPATNYVCWYITFYKKKLEEGGYSRKQFAGWARLNGLLVTDKGTGDTKVVKVNNKSQRFVILKIDHEILKAFYDQRAKDEVIEEENPEPEPVKTEELEQISLSEFEETKETPFDVDDPIFD